MPNSTTIRPTRPDGTSDTAFPLAGPRDPANAPVSPGRRRQRIAGSVLLSVASLGMLDMTTAAAAQAAPSAAPAAASKAAVPRAPRAGRARRGASSGHRRIRRGGRATQGYPGSAAAPTEVAAAIHAYFPQDQWEKAFNVSWKESRWSPTASNGVCFGLFQMHRVHQARAAELGLSWDAVRTNADANTRLAADVWRHQGWRPWVTA